MLISRAAVCQIVFLTVLLSVVAATSCFFAPKYSAVGGTVTSSVLLTCIVLGAMILAREARHHRGEHVGVSVNEVILWNVFFVSGGAAVASAVMFESLSGLMFTAVAGVSLVALWLVRIVDRLATSAS